MTTLCAALLSGFAAERVRLRQAGRAPRRERVVLIAFAAIFAAAAVASPAGGFLDRLVLPHLAVLRVPAQVLLPAIRDAFRGDALLGLVAVAAVASIAALGEQARARGYLLGFATLLLAFFWGLPLFVSADNRDLERPPAIARELKGPGRLYTDPDLSQFSIVAGASSHPELPPSSASSPACRSRSSSPRRARRFGVRSLFDADPDGSYGWFNRLAGEALTISTPPQKSRLLRAFGARWVLADESKTYPGFRPVTAFSVAGRRLALLELPDPLPELRWAEHDWRVASLSGALDLLRSEAFRPDSDIVLPGAASGAASSLEAGPARANPADVRADRATAEVEAAQPGYVVFSRTHFPTWKASLDGRPVPVLVANGRELAVAVPAGRHEVAFWWGRASFERGVALQIWALLIVLVTLVPSRRRKAVSR